MIPLHEKALIQWGLSHTQTVLEATKKAIVSLSWRSVSGIAKSPHIIRNVRSFAENHV